MNLLQRLTNFINKLKSTLLPDKLNVLYKYSSDKTLSIIIKNISTATVYLLKSNKQTLDLFFNDYFGYLPIYIINFGQLNFTLIDISKVNYNKFLQIIKLNNSEYSNCDNYFCAFIEYKNLCFSNNKFTNLELYSEIFNRVRNIDFFTFTNETILDKGCKLLYYNLPSLDWINSQIIYINSLDNLSKKIINLYTKTGDRLINNYLRNLTAINKIDIYDIFVKNYTDNQLVYNELMSSNVYSSNSIETYTRRLIKKIRSIIEGSPIIDKSFYVYRGRTDKVIASSNYNLESFVSTSLLSKIAIDFSNNKFTGEYGTIIRFKIRGRALLLSNSKYLKEYEILLPFGYNYTLKNQQMCEFITTNKTKVNINYIEYS